MTMELLNLSFIQSRMTTETTFIISLRRLSTVAMVLFATSFSVLVGSRSVSEENIMSSRRVGYNFKKLSSSTTFKVSDDASSIMTKKKSIDVSNESNEDRSFIRRRKLMNQQKKYSSSSDPLVVRIRLECQTEPFLHCEQRRRRQLMQRDDELVNVSSNVFPKQCLQKVIAEQHRIRQTIESRQPQNKTVFSLDENENDDSSVQINLHILNVTQRLVNAIYLEVRLNKATIPFNDPTLSYIYNTDDTVLTTLEKLVEFLTSINGVANVVVSDEYKTASSSTSRIMKELRKGNSNHDLNNHEQRDLSPLFEGISGRIATSAFYNVSVYNDTHPFKRVGIDTTRTKYCASGDKIRIAVLDTGIDYTHTLLGGPGTVDAYQESIAIKDRSSNKYFPNDVVIAGYDFVGDLEESTVLENTVTENGTNIIRNVTGISAVPDPNPIDDVGGHGTSVSNVIHSIAPDAKIIAVKICSTTASLCPDFAIVQGLEYILDPNYDGSLSDRADIVNLSLGEWYSSPYYSIVAKAIDNVFAFGVLPVVAAGNHGNIPYIIGSASGNPNSLTVGATLAEPSPFIRGSQLAAATNNGIFTVPIIASYSSRGPTSDLSHSIIKPDLVAPGGPFELARAGTGDDYKVQQGTSFATPIVVGCAALLMEKCRSCTPFVVKALLMNRANRNIMYNRNSSDTSNNDRSPVTLSGSGEVNIETAFLATYWVYSVQDVNPSVSLGIINAAVNVTTITRTLRIVPIPGFSSSNTSETILISISTDFRNKTQELLGAVRISYEPSSIIVLNNISCDNNSTNDNNNNYNDRLNLGRNRDEYYHEVNVTFTIDGTLAPVNRMTYSGADALDPSRLDYHEFDGWIVLTANITNYVHNDTAVVPFHMILRKASNVSIQNTQFDSFVSNSNFETGNSTASSSRNTSSSQMTNQSLDEKLYRIDLQNNGKDVAQLDFYELIHISQDDREPNRGSNDAPADIRYVGYRTVQVVDEVKENSDDCSWLIEFAITLWEGKTTLSTTNFLIYIDIDNDETFDWFLYTASPVYGFATYPDCRLFNISSNEEVCTYYPYDYSTNSANTVVRVCSNDLGIIQQQNNHEPISLNIMIRTISFPDVSVSDGTNTVKVLFPVPALSSPSLDVAPGQTVSSIQVFGTGIQITGKPALGLLLFTNGYRSRDRTGAATKETEAFVITQTNGTQIVYPEVTPDILVFPTAEFIVGPTCGWFDMQQDCTDSSSRLLWNNVDRSFPIVAKEFVSTIPITFQSNNLIATSTIDNTTNTSSVCPLFPVPRPKLATQVPNTIATTTPTLRVSSHPTTSPASDRTISTPMPISALSPLLLSASPLTTLLPTDMTPTTASKVPTSRSSALLSYYSAAVLCIASATTMFIFECFPYS